MHILWDICNHTVIFELKNIPLQTHHTTTYHRPEALCYASSQIILQQANLFIATNKTSTNKTGMGVIVKS